MGCQAHMRKYQQKILILISTFQLVACGKGWTQAGSIDSPSSEAERVITPTSSTTTTTTATPAPPYKFEALLWESVKKGSESWSQFVFSLLQTPEAHILLEAQDMDRFCRKYKFLTEMQKINVVGELIAAMTRYESNYNPLNRYQEDTMGIDPVTHLPVWSEGLMQLSYQDTLGRPYCQFDWNVDKNLSPTSPKKSILDPFKNLNCGVRILADQVRRRGLIVIASGAYWAVIRDQGASEKIDEIASLVNTLKMCQ
jgi:hypothetical protein